MGLITTGGLAELLDPSIRKTYLETGLDRPPEHQFIYNIGNMDWNPMTDQQISGLGTMPTKPEGTQFVLDMPLEGPQKAYKAVAYGMGIEMTFEMWDDDMFGVMSELSAELKRSSLNRIEVDAAFILNNAFNTAVNGFSAGESLCDTAHIGLDGITRSNRPAVDIGFSQTGLQDGSTNFENTTNERDLPRLMAPTKIIIAPENKYIAREILGSTGKAFTADNELNALLDDDLRAMIYHYLAVKANWFLIAAQGTHDMNFFWRNQPIMDAFDDPRTKNAVFTAYQRHTKGFAAWRGTYGSTG